MLVMKQATEKQIEDSILQFLLAKKYFAWKLYDQAYYRDGAYRKQSAFQIRGQSDVVAIREGRVLTISRRLCEA